MKIRIVTIILLFLLCIFSGTSSAQYLSLVESDANSGPGSELAVLSFSTFDDLINANMSSSLFSSIDLAGAFSSTGLTYIPEVTEQPVPETGTLAMQGLGLLGLGIVARRRNS